jgi:hypothetical protein
MKNWPRIVVLVMALFWLAHLSAGVYRAQRVNDELRVVAAKVEQFERDRASAAVLQESRLTRIETQLSQLNETANKAVYGVVGTMLLIVVNSLMGLIIRKPKDV